MHVPAQPPEEQQPRKELKVLKGLLDASAQPEHLGERLAGAAQSVLITRTPCSPFTEHVLNQQDLGAAVGHPPVLPALHSDCISLYVIPLAT